MRTAVFHKVADLREWLAEHERASRRAGAPRYAWRRAAWSIDRLDVPGTSCRWRWRATGLLSACGAEREPEQLAIAWLCHRDTFPARSTFEDWRLALADVRMVLQLCRRIEAKHGWEHEVTGHVRPASEREAA